MFTVNVRAMFVVKAIGLWVHGVCVKATASIHPDHVQFCALKTMDSLRRANAIWKQNQQHLKIASMRIWEIANQNGTHRSGRSAVKVAVRAFKSVSLSASSQMQRRRSYGNRKNANILNVHREWDIAIHTTVQRRQQCTIQELKWYRTMIQTVVMNSPIAVSCWRVSCAALRITTRTVVSHVDWLRTISFNRRYSIDFCFCCNFT
jgi:hypothetical protein